MADSVSREKRNGLPNIEVCVEATTQGFEKYIKQSKKELITTARNSDININTRLIK